MPMGFSGYLGPVEVPSRWPKSLSRNGLARGGEGVAARAARGGMDLAAIRGEHGDQRQGEAMDLGSRTKTQRREAGTAGPRGDKAARTLQGDRGE